MRLGRGFTAVARQVPRLAGLAGLCPAPLTARYARRALGGHAAWPGFYRRGTTGATARRSGRALPCAPHCALCAQGTRGTCGLAGVLPPWHNECHGSPVWQGFALRPSLRAMRAGHSGDMRLGRGFTAVAQQVPRLAGLAGLCPAPLTARYARRALGGHAAWPGFYRRGTTGATARRSGRAKLPLGLQMPPFPCQNCLVCKNTATFSRSHASYKGRNCRFSSGFPSESRFCS